MDSPEDQEAGAEIVERPDGFYWVADDGVTEVGPFASYEAAEADRDSVGDDVPEHCETPSRSPTGVSRPWRKRRRSSG